MDFIETSVKYFDAIYNKILIVLLEKKLSKRDHHFLEYNSETKMFCMNSLFLRTTFVTLQHIK